MRSERAVTLLTLLALCAALALPGVASSAPQEQQAVAALETGAEAGDARPVELADILEWNRIGGTTLSRDGSWLAYRLSPLEGDGEVVVRSTTGETEYRFDAGEAQGGFGGGGSLEFSGDSRWFAFTISPDRATRERNEERRQPSRDAAGLVDLASGEMTEVEGIRSFAFDGDRGEWLALHRYPPRAARGGGGGGGGGAGGPGGDNGDDERARGSDLLLHELATGLRLNVGNVAEFAFDDAGERLAWIVDTEGKAGNGVQLRDMASGVVRPLESAEASYRRLSWTDEGDALAVLRGVDDDGHEEMLHSVVGFTGMDGSAHERHVYDPRDDDAFPAGMTISPNRTPSWTEERDALLFGIHDARPTDDASGDEEAGEEAGEGEEGGQGEDRPGDRDGDDELDEDDKPDLVLWHWEDERLQSMQQVQEQRDRNFSFLAAWRPGEDRFVRLADEEVDSVSPGPEGRWAVGSDDTRYELTGNLNGQRFRDVYAIDMHTGDRRMVLERARWVYGDSPDGGKLLYYEDGHYHVLDLATGTSTNITEDVPTSFINTEDDHNVQDPPISPIGWVKDGVSVLLYDNWDIWNVAVDGSSATNLTVDGRDEQIRYRRFRLDPDEEGIDLGEDVYLAPYGEWTKRSGIGRIPAGGTGVEMLLWDDASFGSLEKAEDADVFVYTRATVQEYPDVHVVHSDAFADPVRLTDANPQQARFAWTAGSQLLDYESEKGDRLQAALFLPANYEPGRSYPTVVYIYEELSQGLNRYTTPSANGFNMSVYTSNGYAVLMPDITYTVNDPGMSAVWCVLPALDAAVETGVVDPDRVGLHGHSWGGYQTSFLVTQTDRFAAAVAGAPLTNMISMYSSIYWNSGSANQPIFESSQGRFTGDYIEATEAYIRNSPVFFADRVTTPLIILHNDEDGAVDWNQGIEYYNTLRRLGKEVVMLQYVGENHGLRKPANRKDYTVRMREFFDHHLKGEPAPQWLLEGVPHLRMDEHLKERAVLVKGTPGEQGDGNGGGGSRR